MPLFSIIVPVYKAEKYISECVDSVLAQTFENFELILADDGSPDRCPEICDEYAKKDSRIKVIHKENGGASSARNSGIDAACGEYIIFLDSDDYWEGNYTLQRLAEKSKDGYDIIMFGCKLLNMKNGEMRLSRNGYNIALLENSKREEALQYLLKSKDIPGAAYILQQKEVCLTAASASDL